MTLETKRSQDEGKADFPSEGEAVTLSRPSAASSLGTVPEKAALPRAWVVSHILRALRTLADYLQRRTLCTFSGCNRGKHGGFATLNRRSEEPQVRAVRWRPTCPSPSEHRRHRLLLQGVSPLLRFPDILCQDTESNWQIGLLPLPLGGVG